MAAAQSPPARPAGPAASSGRRATTAAAGSEWPAEPSPPPPPPPVSAPSPAVLRRPLQGAPGLSVQQLEPHQKVVQGSSIQLTCRVTLPEVAEKLRLEWLKDGQMLCQALLSGRHLSPGPCGHRGHHVSWQPPETFFLHLDHVTLNDSGDYVCGATLEIPLLEEAKGNGSTLEVLAGENSDSSLPGPHVALLLAGGVALTVTLTLLGSRFRSRRRRHLDSAHPLYSNVLNRPRNNPKESKTRPMEEAQDAPGEDQECLCRPCTSLPLTPAATESQTPQLRRQHFPRPGLL
ncbi:transmembrane and immunoglobulin domain-containing protein 2 [Erinaceus europaeus]|uniref:transmembrane and immunoglobulin domain-containing protein 2 n=1 Tax=Erinaceus europaeus TaxID=9365 RepID=UPI0028FC9F26|nr:transmembrane and immunoglobulin domain-containing protein 2 [Erinaceus europaeus]